MEEIANLRRSGLKLQEIGDKFGITRERVRQKLKEYNNLSEKPVIVPRTRSMLPKVVERREKVINLYRKGLPTAEIAKKFNVPSSIISADIRKYNKTAKEPVIIVPTKLNIEVAKRRKKVADLYLSGKTLKEIAKIMDMTIHVVWQDISKYASKNGIVIKKRNRFKEKDLQDIQRMRKFGISASEIAEKYNVCITTVYNVFKRNNIK